MKTKYLITSALLLTSLTYTTNYATAVEPLAIVKAQKTKYEERKDWIEERKYGLLSLCDKLINSYDLPKTNIESTREKLKLKVRMYEKDIQDVDYANDKKFESIKRKFDEIEAYFQNYTQHLKDKAYLRR